MNNSKKYIYDYLASLHFSLDERYDNELKQLSQMLSRVLNNKITPKDQSCVNKNSAGQIRALTSCTYVILPSLSSSSLRTASSDTGKLTPVMC